ncbi:hypothetical protein AJ79_00564 [Helicocarpus griseus UAMH5409]|uniref:peptidyl-tRNA hydrolase n=1 Tax=Helicocarpus griseus UAMH5409 TaxID=1447875 RepID=A0A2B7YAD9_9EURO|nr:hypothetical protein AJ79_00564 [Helicocarpus griseus UAMH5409]
MHPPPPLFLASIGNPPPRWHLTLHSAGHILLNALARKLRAPLTAPGYDNNNTPPRSHPGPFVARTRLPESLAPLTLWQSPSLMNVSGPGVVRAYEKWCRENGVDNKKGGRGTGVGAAGFDGLVRGVGGVETGRGKGVIDEDGNVKPLLLKKTETTTTTPADEANTKPIPLNLILLHDDLELSPGKLSVRRGNATLSARGHNGIKSVVDSLVKAGLLASPRGGKRAGTAAVGMGAGGDDVIDPAHFQLTRIGVGIGRPASREAAVVAEYVLGRMPERQVEVTEELVGDLVEVLEKEVKGMMVT